MNKFCFANHGGKCAALEPQKGCCRGCRFFKSKARAEADRAHALELIADKPADQQEYIAEKYYCGTMPWKEDACAG